jgi:hypothetical protein
MSADADDELLRAAVLAFVAAQRRLLLRLDALETDPAGVAAAMTAELDQLAAATEPRGRQLGSRLRSDPGD